MSIKEALAVLPESVSQRLKGYTGIPAIALSLSGDLGGRLADMGITIIRRCTRCSDEGHIEIVARASATDKHGHESVSHATQGTA